MIGRLIVLLLVALAAVNGQYSVVSQDVGTTYVKLGLKYTGQSDYYVKPKSKIIKELVFHFKALSYSDFTFKIYDPNNERFEIPQGGIFPNDAQASFSYPLSYASYKINFTVNHFSFLIVRKSTEAVLFDSSVVQLEFSEYYIQFGTILDSKTLFGYSERNAPHFKLTPGTWTIFNNGRGQVIDQGSALNGKQTHGFYPAYLLRENSGNHHVGYLRTTNAVDVEIESFSNTSYLKIFRVIGGIIDFRFILGEKNPQDLLITFHNFIGASFVPPFWSLGFHQCRWGYQNITALQTVIAKYKENDIPLDTIWSDIDYMHQFQTFTVDTDNFPLKRLKAILKDHQYVLIVEPSIRKVGYAYEQGKRKDVYIKDAAGKSYLDGKVWAGPVHFPDFFHPNATAYWKDMMQFLYQQVPFSGIWLDMNEIDNMCDGLCTSPAEPSTMDYSVDIPYTPGGGNIEQQTISLNSTHFGKLLEANVHPLFGLMHLYNSFQFMKNLRRPFILTRSSTFGSNRYGFHWTGDNYANFTFLRNSIYSNFMFGLWGVQMIGSDICGFGGNATVEVCSRFFQLGSLYPFSRNHNELGKIDQEPYALGPVVLQSSKKNLKLRYSLLKFYFRQFLIRKGVGTIFRPLYFQFYNDENVLSDSILQTQFLLGKSLMSTPIVQQGQTSRTVYFPEIMWFNFHTGEPHPAKSLGLIENSLTDLVPLFLRSGRLIFSQNVDNVTKSRELGNNFTLTAGLQLSKSDSMSVTYIAEGGLLSLGDYNNEAEVQKCIAEDCDYAVSAVLTIQKLSKEKQLVLSYTFKGRSVKYVQLLSEFVLFAEEEVIKYRPAQGVEIYGSGSQTLKFK